MTYIVQFMALLCCVATIGTSYSHALSSQERLQQAGVTLDENDGTYRTISEVSDHECQEICQKDTQTPCRGISFHYIIGEEKTGLCHLNNGQSVTSIFNIKAPEPIDLELAVSELNDYRASKGLNPLKLNQTLIVTNQIHSDDMAMVGDISHTGWEGSSVSERATGNG